MKCLNKMLWEFENYQNVKRQRCFHVSDGKVVKEKEHNRLCYLNDQLFCIFGIGLFDYYEINLKN